MEEPILIVEAADAPRLWAEDGRWLELEELPVAGGGTIERWRTGVSTVLTLAAAAGIFAVGLTFVPPTAPVAAPAASVASAESGETHRAMFARIVELEEANHRLYTTIEATHRQLAGIEVIRARMEAAAAPGEEPAVQTADARLR